MRGVYRDIQFHGRQAVGSSPHARGLREQGKGEIDYTRIIPACAGFTLPWPMTRRLPPDHPRMRGVYGAPSVSHPGE